MEKVKFKNLPLVYPYPAVLAGAIVDGKPNYTTLGDCGIMSVKPPVIYISSHKSHYLNQGIVENGVYSVNFPPAELVKKVDYCGLVSGNKTDKSSIFETFFGETDKAPMIDECPINLVCRVIKTFDVYDMVVFIGEIIETFVWKECLSNGFPDTKKINPLIYCMDNQYWDIGKVVGKGFSDGKCLIK
jgi:flavin reductase (DIM6/NTAB) family NADH-FMN oxidoreductase RutF